MGTNEHINKSNKSVISQGVHNIDITYTPDTVTPVSGHTRAREPPVCVRAHAVTAVARMCSQRTLVHV